MRNERAACGWLLAASLLAACGAQPSTHPSPVSIEPPATWAPPTLPLPLPNVGGAAVSAHDTLVKAIAAFRAMPAYEAKMAFMQKQGSASAKGVYSLSGKQPRTLRTKL